MTTVIITFSEENLKCFDNRICLCQNPLHQFIPQKRTNVLIWLGHDASSSTLQNRIASNAVGRMMQYAKRVFLRQHALFQKMSLRFLEKFVARNMRRVVGGGLSCQNGACNCIDDCLRYSPTLQSCLDGQGSPCGKVLLRKSWCWMAVVQFIMELSNKHNYPPADSGQINFKRIMYN